MTRLVTYNIQFSRGRDGRCDLVRIADTVRGADVIALQEVERHWPRSGMADQPAELSALLPEYYWVYGPFFDMDASLRKDGSRVVNRRRQFGSMLLAKQPIAAARSNGLPMNYYGDRFNMQMGVLDGVVTLAGCTIHFYVIHNSYLDSDERLRHLDRLFELAASNRAAQGIWSGPGDIRGDDWSGGTPPPPLPEALCWMGDFNATPDSDEYARVTQASAGGDCFVDSWVAAGNPPAEGVTYPEGWENSRPKGPRIDYIFVDETLAARVKAAAIDVEADGSDHQPVWCDLDL